MSDSEDMVNAHWRALGTVAIAAVLTAAIFGAGVSIGYALGRSAHSIHQEETR